MTPSTAAVVPKLITSHIAGLGLPSLQIESFLPTFQQKRDRDPLAGIGTGQDTLGSYSEWSNVAITRRFDIRGGEFLMQSLLCDDPCHCFCASASIRESSSTKLRPITGSRFSQLSCTR